MIEVKVQHLYSGEEYDNLSVETKGMVTMTSSSLGTRVVFYEARREDIQGIADELNKWLGAK